MTENLSSLLSVKWRIFPPVLIFSLNCRDGTKLEKWTPAMLENWKEWLQKLWTLVDLPPPPPVPSDDPENIFTECYFPFYSCNSFGHNTSLQLWNPYCVILYTFYLSGAGYLATSGSVSRNCLLYELSVPIPLPLSLLTLLERIMAFRH